jgi:putative SOS response-associated peptidase YedK
MCGRFTLRASPKEVADLFSADVQLALLPRFNICPTQNVLAIRAGTADSASSMTRREAVELRWGLVPSWTKDPTIGNSLINARAETLATKPAFRNAFAQRRCLIPADGFYEWQKGQRSKQPFFVTRVDRRPFAFAGVHERWHHGELVIESCTIITTEANELLTPLHDRMPVILPERDFSTWLNTAERDTARLQLLLRPIQADELNVTRVGAFVNLPANDDPECIKATLTDPQPTKQRSNPQSRTLFDLNG